MAGRTMLEVLRCLTLASALFYLPLWAQNAEPLETLLKDGGPFINLAVENNTLYAGDTLVLEINSSGLLEPVDVSSIFKRTTFVRETFGTKIGVQNGKVVEIALRRIEVTPKEEGLLVLGPLQGESSGGPVSSNSLAVNVGAAPDENWVPAENDLNLTMQISKSNPFIGEQFQLTIQLEHRYAIAGEALTLPIFKGFDVVPIVEERRLIDNSSGMRTTTWRYHLHAHRSGAHTLDGVQWSATLIRSRLQRYDFSLQHAPLNFTVAAVDNSFPENTWWLAAESVTLSDEWSADLIQLSAGDEITRTISLNATGVLSNHLPVIQPLATRSFHSTPLPELRIDETIGEVTKATGIYKFRMIAEAPVSVFLDTVRVPWFNTETRKMEEAIIPARRVDVGLPKRPDQLAELAIKRHNLNTFTLWLRSISVSQWLLFTAALLTVALILSIGSGTRWPRITTFFHLRYHRLRWRYWAFTGQWQKLYDAMLRSPSPFGNNKLKERLIYSIGQQLFTPQDVTAGATANTETKLLWQEFTKSNPTEDTDPSPAKLRALPTL